MFLRFQECNGPVAEESDVVLRIGNRIVFLDNGIDGIIEIVDDLQKTTKILIQAKVRTKFVTLKEVREFYGAFKSEKADVGIFITNATYHKEAIKFSKNLNDLVLINDEILLNICNITNTGIKQYNDAYILDEDIFVNENFKK